MFGSDCKTPPPSSQTGGFMHSGGFRHRYFLTSLSSYGFQPTDQSKSSSSVPAITTRSSLKNRIFSHLLNCTGSSYSISFRAHRLLTLDAQRGAEIAAAVALRRASSVLVALLVTRLSPIDSSQIVILNLVTWLSRVLTSGALLSRVNQWCLLSRVNYQWCLNYRVLTSGAPKQPPPHPYPSKVHSLNLRLIWNRLRGRAKKERKCEKSVESRVSGQTHTDLRFELIRSKFEFYGTQVNCFSFLRIQ